MSKMILANETKVMKIANISASPPRIIQSSDNKNSKSNSRQSRTTSVKFKQRSSRRARPCNKRIRAQLRKF